MIKTTINNPEPERCENAVLAVASSSTGGTARAWATHGAQHAKTLPGNNEGRLGRKGQTSQQSVGGHSLVSDREIIDHLWDVLDDPHLNKALGLPQNFRMTFRRSRF
jgi:hypothetical protein